MECLNRPDSVSLAVGVVANQGRQPSEIVAHTCSNTAIANPSETQVMKMCKEDYERSGKRVEIKIE
jgi:hypothetical protein